MVRFTRRKLLRIAGASAVATAGIAGCVGGANESSRSTGESPGTESESLDALTVAYVPIYPNMQQYVMTEEGYYENVPADVTTERFSSGPSVVKAFASGDVDVAFFGISPAMVLADKGADAGILAANSRNGFKVMGTSELVDLYERKGGTAFEAFESEHGRKVRFGAPPDGSVPDVVLRYWIREDLGAGEMERVVSKSNVPPAKAVQTMQSGGIDATIIQEPFATIIGRQEGFGELVWSGDVLENHPVTVLFANRRVLDDGDISRSLVEQHVAATEFATDSPDAAAAHAASVIGSGASEQLARAAMDSRASEFISDPHAITDQTATMGEFVASVGNIEEPVATENLFAFGPYDGVQR